MKIAAVTMVYNEAQLLPVWLRHYGQALGAAHCHVIDHGSDDGSTKDLGHANRLRLPRSPHDDDRRAGFISQFCAGLLSWYDAVIHTDVDELLVADPAKFDGLADYARGMQTDVATAIGLNVLHLSRDEKAIRLDRPVGKQRHYGWLTSAMCKPVLIRRPVVWSPGFHSADAPVAFGGLFLFHLRYFDRDLAVARLGRTRRMDWAGAVHGAHQRVEDAEFTHMLGRLEAMDRREDADFDIESPLLADWLEGVRRSQAGREDAMYKIDLNLDRFELWRIPKRFRQAF